MMIVFSFGSSRVSKLMIFPWIVILTHLCDHLIQCDRFVIKILSVNKVRIISDLDRTVEVLFPEFLSPLLPVSIT